ncbi:transglycosylase SLT domain-containing protein [Mesorhizobium sp. YR577]|uniref:transglycosylase SLT domain-containing protein n=1 Tax=Mesorhizobium sp. YR577 TaxID=1884373 RepID=UPI0008E8E2AC|nr:transglycosylase SLT domain-containing protein [Mesorhizobium sp. YR577]SFU02645.1 Soluble lytic murein transglycosylase [Mesorhizobium sp. YR577]
MKKLTVLTAAFAVGLIGFAANAEAASTRKDENVVVVPSVKGKANVKVADAKVSKRDVKKTTSVKKTDGVRKAKAQKSGSKVKQVVMKSRKSGKKTEIDMTQTASIGKKGANTQKYAGAQYSSIVARYAATYGVPVSLAHAVIRVESNYNPNARGSAGEIGLMQIKPSTARMMGYSGGAGGLFNPETNIKFGMKYLAMAHSLGGGTTCGTVLKYNAGHAATRMNPVSSAYCSKVKQQLAMN